MSGETARRPSELEADLAEAESLLGALNTDEREEAERLIGTVRNPRASGVNKIKAQGRLGEMGLIPDRSDPSKKPPGEPVPQGLPSFRNGLKVVGAVKAEVPRRRLIMWNLEEFQAEEVEWLWPGRFPYGRGSLIVGDGGVGKSTLTGFMAAVITSGGRWPDAPLMPVPPGSVIFLTDEEDTASDLRPKIDAFGGDCTKVKVVAMIKDEHDQEYQFNLARDMPLLAEEVVKIGDVRLIVVDPIGAYFEGRDSYGDPEVRARLRPLLQLARKHRIAVLLVMHLTKNEEKNIRSRVMGAAAFVNNCRMAWFFSEDPEDERNRRLLTFLKGNPKGKKTTGLAVSFPDEERLVWDPRPVHLTANQVGRLLYQRPHERAAGVVGKRGPRPEKTLGAMRLILDALKAGPAPQAAVQDALARAGVTESTFNRALRRLLEKTKQVIRPPDRGDGPLALQLAPPAATQGELLPVPAPEVPPVASP